MENNPDVVSYLRRKYYKWPALTPEISDGQKQILKNIDIIGKIQSDDYVTLTLAHNDAIRYVLVYKSGKKYTSNLQSKKIVDKIFVNTETNQIQIPKSILTGNHFAVTFWIEMVGNPNQQSYI
ncbi:hypothetical protein NYZ99_06825 [Maribacter litopenaei]|uniref:Uncharacterized protein n=1 Tax=Maribacter litopenaei TaxID=2976127 RepID=A0ABY5YDT0_9FLAO|nr:hypothetical protein [Maribacter litopenaei]UWX56026.1 hypothetical protein NYZ99_06825 [Maribacter litopenaei]